MVFMHWVSGFIVTSTLDGEQSPELKFDGQISFSKFDSQNKILSVYGKMTPFQDRVSFSLTKAISPKSIN